MSDGTARGVTAPLQHGGELGAMPDRDTAPTAPPTVPLAAAPAAQRVGVTVPPHSTVPLAVQPAVGRATQMSASAVPSTLESPKDPMLVRAEAETRIERPLDTALPLTLDREGYGATLPDDAARDAAIREATRLADAQAAAMSGTASDEPSRRYGPATLMSPTPGANGGDGAATAARDTSEDAVVDAILPAAAFLPARGSGDRSGLGNDSPAPNSADGGGALAHWGTPGAHAGAFEARDPRQGAPAIRPGPGGSLAPPGYDPRAGAPRGSSTPLIIMVVVGVVVLVGALAVVAGGALLLRSRAAAAARATKAAQGAAPTETSNLPAPGAAPGGAASPSTTTTAAPGETAPRAQQRPTSATSRVMGGTKARLSALTAGSLDLEGARAAIGTALPRIDACFANSELEPPNHESAAYDLEVAPSGAVTRADPATQTGRAAKLDTCVGAALRSARMPKSAGGSRVKLVLSARIADLQPTR